MSTNEAVAEDGTGAQAASETITVGQAQGPATQAQGPATQAAPAGHPSASGRLSAVLREARPRQWPKNLLVFAAPLAGETTGRPDGLVFALLAAIAFLCASVSVYFVNDIMDAERDRRHPVKCHRPIACGDLRVRDAIVIAALLALVAIGTGFAIGTPMLSAVTGSYLVTSTFYSTRGKHVPYLEMVLVASGFVLRVLAGAVATMVPPSPWFLAVCSLGAFSVAVAKRYAEITSLGAEAVKHRPVTRWYRGAVIRALQGVVAVAMIVTYITWAAHESAGTSYWHLASAVPLMLALIRFAILTGRRSVRPVEDMITRDGRMLACEAVWLALFIVGLYQ
ncbi:MAG TPA: decaprenyl-phosphate phosphoribosyltransferase [Trebonia sp.]|nr:decaprenyl-phosphate phosphoribosyltransferase [Trebonia sp.]